MYAKKRTKNVGIKTLGFWFVFHFCEVKTLQNLSKFNRKYTVLKWCGKFSKNEPKC